MERLLVRIFSLVVFFLFNPVEKTVVLSSSTRVVPELMAKLKADILLYMYFESV